MSIVYSLSEHYSKHALATGQPCHLWQSRSALCHYLASLSAAGRRQAYESPHAAPSLQTAHHSRFWTSSNPTTRAPRLGFTSNAAARSRLNFLRPVTGAPSRSTAQRSAPLLRFSSSSRPI